MVNINKLFKHLSIRTKLIIAFVFLSIVPLITVGLYTIKSNVKTLRAIAANRVYHDIETIKERSESFLAHIDTDLRFLSESYFFKELIDSYASYEAESTSVSNINIAHAQAQFEKARLSAEDRIGDFIQKKKIYYQIRYLDKVGDELLRVEFEPLSFKAHAVPQSQLRRKWVEEHYFFMASLLQSGESSFVPTELKAPEDPLRLIPAISYILPIFHPKQKADLEGILIANTFVQDFFRILDRPDKPKSDSTGDIILVSKEGFYLYHPDKKQDWGTLLASRDTDNLYHDYPSELAAEVLSGKPGGIVEYKDEMIAYAPLFTRSQPDNFYVIIWKTPKAAFFASVRSFQIIFFLLVLFSLLISSLLGYLAARHFTTPIMDMIRDTKAIADGDFSHRLSVETNDEIEEMAKNLNRMAEAIKEREDQIQHHAKDLEEKLTERTRQLSVAHAQIMQSEKLAATGKLAAGVAHEINNPISVIINRIECMMLETGADAEGAKLPQNLIDDLEVINIHAHRIAQITRGLLTFARKAPADFSPIEVNSLVEEVLLLMEKELVKSKINVERQLAVDLPSILANANQIQQVIINLLNNAWEAMPNGGSISIKTERILKGEKGEAVQLSISDTGHGVNEEKLNKLFDPFFTTKERGTGLGLSISYGIVKEHNGQIEVESEPGKGTTFTITLPAATNKSV